MRKYAQYTFIFVKVIRLLVFTLAHAYLPTVCVHAPVWFVSREVVDTIFPA